MAAMGPIIQGSTVPSDTHTKAPVALITSASQGRREIPKAVMGNGSNLSCP